MSRSCRHELKTTIYGRPAEVQVEVVGAVDAYIDRDVITDEGPMGENSNEILNTTWAGWSAQNRMKAAKTS
jgi:hypothetical protein